MLPPNSKFSSLKLGIVATSGKKFPGHGNSRIFVSHIRNSNSLLKIQINQKRRGKVVPHIGDQHTKNLHKFDKKWRRGGSLGVLYEPFFQKTNKNKKKPKKA